MFTQPCFIRKNTPELRMNLKQLGYKCNNGKWMGSYIATFKRDDSNDLFYCGTPEYDLPNNPSLNNSINCGTNEDLFLAIAALRDDTDKNQWFIWNVTDYDVKHTYEWILCTEDKIEDMLFYDCQWRKARKATVEELFNHFNK